MKKLALILLVTIALSIIGACQAKQVTVDGSNPFHSPIKVTPTPTTWCGRPYCFFIPFQQ